MQPMPKPMTGTMPSMNMPSMTMPSMTMPNPTMGQVSPASQQPMDAAHKHHMKEMCKKYHLHLVYIEMSDGSVHMGIIDSMDDDHVSLLMPAGESEEQRFFGFPGGFGGFPGGFGGFPRRFRFFRRGFFPFFGLRSLFFPFFI